MNLKNFNPFERHVEKITLAVAAVGAAYMIWLAYPPMLSIDTPSGPLPADQVENAVSMQVNALEEARDQTRKLQIKNDLKDYVAEYRSEMQEQPLPSILVDAGSMPSFVPPNIAVENLGSNDTPHDLPIATPTVPGPTDTSSQSFRGVFLPAAAAGAGAPVPPPPPGAAPVAGFDKDIVLVKGLEDLNAFLKQMADPDLPAGQHLPLSLQRTVITKVELQSRYRKGGSWTPFENVPPSMASTVQDVDWSKVVDADLQATLNGLDQNFKQIAQPDYLPLLNGTSVLQQLLGGAAASVTPGAAPVPPGPFPGPVPFPNPGPGPVSVPGAAPGAAPTGPVPIWAIDDHVQAGKEYQYQMRVVMYNPTYRWPHALKTPAMRLEPTLTSDWVLVPNTVEVKASMYFFIMGAIGQHSQVTALIYKWNAGRWDVFNVSVEPGVVIQTFKTSDIKSQDVDTKNTVVDVVQSTTSGDVTVVLMDENGELFTRLASTDRASKIKQDIDHQIAASVPQPTTKPATPGTPKTTGSSGSPFTGGTSGGPTGGTTNTPPTR